MTYTREIDSEEEYIVPKDEYLLLCGNDVKYKLIQTTIETWESHSEDTADGNALKYRLIVEMIDRWEHRAEESDKGEKE